MKGRKRLKAIDTKICTRCRQVKSFEDFYKRKDTKDGRHYYCKICSREKRKRHYYMQKTETPEEKDNHIQLEKKIKNIEQAIMYIIQELSELNKRTKGNP